MGNPIVYDENDLRMDLRTQRIYPPVITAVVSGKHPNYVFYFQCGMADIPRVIGEFPDAVLIARGIRHYPDLTLRLDEIVREINKGEDSLDTLKTFLA
ncbi:MAG: hypothetical protein AABX54_05870 [Nanoarchaeota archaeon]